MLKTRLALLPETVSRFAPGPAIARFILSCNSPEVNVTFVNPAWYFIVAPEHACKITSRNDPAPLSLPLVTTVDPQFTVIVAVAAPPPRPPIVLFNDAPTEKLPLAVLLSAGVNFNPALPSAIVIKSRLLPRSTLFPYTTLAIA